MSHKDFNLIKLNNLSVYHTSNIFLENYYYTISILLLLLIILFCLYKDLKFRKINNNNFQFIMLLSILLSIIESRFYFSISYLILKFFYIILNFLLSILLFSLKIIGGSDGKLCILIFSIHPVKFITISKINFFYMFFLLQYLILLTITFIMNQFSSRKYSFDIFIRFYMENLGIKKVYIKTSYILINFSNLEKKRENKYIKKFNILLYNKKRGKFQILVQYRPPLILFFLFSYLLMLI